VSDAYTLTELFEKLTHGAAGGARNASASEVVREALHLLVDEGWRATTLSKLRTDTTEGIEDLRERAANALLRRLESGDGAKGFSTEATRAANASALPHRKSQQSLAGYCREHLERLERGLAWGVPYEALAHAAHIAGFEQVDVRSLQTTVYRARKTRREPGAIPAARYVGKFRRRFTSEVTDPLSPPSNDNAALDRPLRARPRRRIQEQIEGGADQRSSDLDRKIVALYTRGLTLREIQALLSGMCALELSTHVIGEVIEAALADVTEWPRKRLDRMYPVVLFDFVGVKICDEGVLRNRAVHMAVGVAFDGMREVLGLWIEPIDGANFWQMVVGDLKRRGLEEILIAVVSGVGGLRNAIEATFPRTTVQTCIVHLIREGLACASRNDRKLVAAALRRVYTAPTPNAAAQCLAEFEADPCGAKFPAIGASWRRVWEHVVPFFALPPEVRRVIYTTDAFDSLHSELCKIIGRWSHFSSDEMATKLIWLALGNINLNWSRATRRWGAAMKQFAILIADRCASASR